MDKISPKAAPELRDRAKATKMVLILGVALRLAKKHGYMLLRRDQIAEAAGCSTGLINKYFKDMDTFRRELIGYAIVTQCHKVIAQAVIMGHPSITSKHQKLVNESLKKYII